MKSAEQHFLDELNSTMDKAFVRTAYADWLEEEGSKKAEIIRKIDSGQLHVIGKPEKETIINAKLTKEQFTQYAADIAESVLHIFEKYYPEDDRPRKAIEAARNSDAAGKAAADESCVGFASDSARAAVWSAATVIFGANVDSYAARTGSYAVRAAYGGAAHARTDAAGKEEQQWKYNLLRLAEYKYFDGHHVWTE